VSEGVVVRDLDGADARVFADGSTRTVAVLPSARIGRGVFLPGWRWSTHAGSQTGRPSERHVGIVLEGVFEVVAADGTRCTVGPGQAFEVGPGHDGWVVGDRPVIALDVAP